MEDIVYQDMIHQEKNHWWFKARREILKSYISRLNTAKNISILEIGCGTGGNLTMLQSFGTVKAVEMDSFAISYAKSTGVTIEKGSLPTSFPYKEKFDLICMFDVLEHIEQDEETLKLLYNFLTPKGKIIITVPAHQWLYGSHDKMLHHKRRYSKKELKDKLTHSHFKIENISYFNTLLFPLVLIARIVDIIKCSNKSIGYTTPNKFLNTIFYSVFRFEKYMLTLINLPYGTSLITTASKNEIL